MNRWPSAARWWLLLILGPALAAVGRSEETLAEAIRAIDPRVLSTEQAAEARNDVRREVRARVKAAETRESAAWYAVKSQADWEVFCASRLDRLRQSLSREPLPQTPRDLRTTGRIDGDGFSIENITFASRPGVIVTANLYRPKTARGPATGFLICHSHHAPKTQGELQDMGMTWARRGSAVLVMDQLGHGERRTHAFAEPGKHAAVYRPERQDYYFRYNTGLQLTLVGESLLGWMVGDLMCGVTVLENLPEVDRKKIVLLGAVAGGGDPAGVAGALDRRIAAVVPFNFGGYEPENAFPLPDDAEQTFPYAGGGDWESTRNLRRSAVDGFLPWTIVAATAPRRLIYAHEFRWDEPRDPVWKRLRTVFGFYHAADRLGSVVGHGTVRESSATASHCTNIGPIHRAQIDPLLARWFDFPATPAEYRARREAAELRCLPADTEPFALHSVLQRLAAERLAAARRRRSGLDLPALRKSLRDDLAPWIGSVEPAAYEESAVDLPATNAAGVTTERRCLALLEPTATIRLPLIILRGAGPAKKSPPIVIAVAQGGKHKMLAERSEMIAECVERGAVVVLCDLRGTGETRPTDEGRGRSSGATSRSATEWMLGQTTVGAQVRDLRTVLRYLRSRDEFRDSSIGLYGDGLVPAGAADRPIAWPLDAGDLPGASEPLGAIVCLLTALWEDQVSAVYGAGGLVSYTSLLDAPYFYVPHDTIVPGLLTVADVADLAACQTARVWLADLRDGANRPATDSQRTALTADARLSARAERGPLKTSTTLPAAQATAAWLLDTESK